jgi:Asp-tRNA(Asn)/Glu-tRNA(Gln) amidotransferase C subunit
MYYILELNKSIFNIFQNLSSGIVQLYKLSNLSNDCKLNIFIEGSITGVYTVKNNKIFLTNLENNEIITNEIDELPFELLFKNGNSTGNDNTKRNIRRNFFNRSKKSSSDINVRLPPVNTDILVTSNNDEFDNLDDKELEKKIEELNKLKEQQVNELENLNENLNEFENNIIQEKYKIDSQKNKLRRDKEKWEEFKNIFNADKKIYRIMKEQLEANQIEDIPELFEKKYPIFATLDEHNLLDKPSEIYDYIKLLPNDDSVYIPNDSLLKNLFDNDNIVTSISLTELKDQNNNFDTSIETDDDK